MKYQTISTDLSLLCVNIENPRFEMVDNQREAISLIIDDQKTKLIRLAQDIINYGLNPTDLITVSNHKKISGQFNVLEGNRRVTALKLLTNPELIPEKYKLIYNAFKKLSEKYYRNPIKEISCVLFLDETEANRWIKLKHTGENDGVGVVSWDTQQKERFDEKIEGKASYALQVINFLKQQNIDDELKKNLPKLPSSSFQRLITDPDFRNTVGIDILEGKVYTKLPVNEVIKPLLKVAKDLLRDDFTVKEIYYKDDRTNYLETFKPSDLPNKSNLFNDGWELSTPNPPENPVMTIPLPQQKKTRKATISTRRNTIIPKSSIIHINQPRINKIFRELKDLDLREFCNAGAITFRVFVELSIDSFIESQKITTVTKDDSLKKKVLEVSSFLESNKHLDKHKLKGIRNSVSNNNHILSIETFNAYVHNKHLSPSENDLKIAWDNIEFFIVKLWELI